MDEQTTAVLRLRAEGVSFRQIAVRLGLPLKKCWQLAQQAVGAEPGPAGEAAAAEVEMVQTPAALGERPAVVYGRVTVLPVPAGALPSLGGVGYQLLTGPSTMPTPEDVRRPYAMPAPGGGVYVVPGLAAMGATAPTPDTAGDGAESGQGR